MEGKKKEKYHTAVGVMEAPRVVSVPQDLVTMTDIVAKMEEKERQASIEDIESECLSILSIYSEETKEIPLPEYAGVLLKSQPFGAVVHKVLEINLYTRESSPYSLVVQENEERQTERPLRFIPLLRLKVFFPLSYPQRTAPACSFVSNWLPTMYLKPLETKLRSMWTAGAPVVFEWADYIQHEFLATLDFAQGRRIVLPRCQKYHDLVDYLLYFDEELDKQEFNSGEQTCNVCGERLPSTGFIRVPNCRHFACKRCFTTYLELKVTEGKITQLTCPESGCNLMLPQTLLKACLSPELFEKYEKFSLHKALEGMSDMTWCPKCEAPAAKETPKSTVGQCLVCNYRFCIKCGEQFHPFVRCKSLENAHADPATLLKILLNANEESKVTKTVGNTLSNLYLKKFTKACPNCTAPILKAGGCNKVQCAKCQKFFCWLCLKCITSYDHFGGQCVLFTAESLAPNEVTDITRLSNTAQQEMVSFLENTQHVALVCPSCAAIGFKPDKLNLIRCETCHFQYCYFCGEEATSKDHYVNSTCLMYS